MNHYIYIITNNINGKQYIGKHSTFLKKDKYFGSGVALRNAIKKHGKENFNKKILFYCEDENELNKMEIFFIKKHNTYGNGYNLTHGGDGVLGKIVSDKTRRKISISNKNYYSNNPDMIKKLSDIRKLRTGNKNSFYGKKLSIEHIEKMTRARVLAITGGANPSAVKVRCVELDIIFETAKEAAVFCKLAYSTTILKSAKKQQKKAGGYTWELVN